MAGLESAIEETVILIAEKNGWLYRKVNWVGRRSAPDRLFSKVVDGHQRVVLIEFKREGEPTPVAQEREHERLRVAGFCVVVCRTIVEALEALDI